MQIMISNELQEQMIEHAKKELPNECCGYITGAGGVCKTFYPMVNVDASQFISHLILKSNLK